MAFEIGKTSSGAKYMIGNNGNTIYLSQAGIKIKNELIGGESKYVVYVLNVTDVIYSGPLDTLLYNGGTISSDPKIAIDFLVSEGWVNFKSGSGQNPDPQASENIPKVISLSLSDIGATSWNDDIKTLLAQHINSLGLDIKSAELYFFEVEGDDGAADPSDVVTSVSASLTNDSELSISYTTAKGALEENKVPLNPLEETDW